MKIPRILSFILLCSLTMNSVNAKLVFVTEENAINTDNFIINADDSSSDFVDLEFGSTLGVKMRYDILNNKFILNRDLSVLGKVGIGTNNPESILHLSSDVDAVLTIEADKDNVNESDNPLLVFKQDGGSVKGFMGINGNDSSLYQDSITNATYIEAKANSDSNIQFVTGATGVNNSDGTARMTIKNTGKVGIGTNNPDELLHIAGNMRLDNSLEDKDGEKGTVGQVLSSTVSGTDWIDTSNSIPFISTTTIQQMPNSSTATLSFTGLNFQPNSTVSIPGFDGTINSTNIISPTDFEINVDSGVNSNVYDIVISNNGVANTQWTGNGNNLLQVFIGNGTSQANSGESCKAILDNGYSTGDGTYWINPDGGDTVNAFQVYCDMTTSGGGWTKLEYSADLIHENHDDGDGADGWLWLPTDFSLSLTNQQINDLRAVSTEGKQTYVGTCDGVINYLYSTSNYSFAFGFRFQNGDTTVNGQQNYTGTNISVPQDGCKTNNSSSTDTIFEIQDVRVPVVNVYSRDNGSASEKFGSPLTNNPAWLR